MTRPGMRVTSVVLGSADPRGLAAFYQQLLGWPVAVDESAGPGQPEQDSWIMLRRPPDEPGLMAMSFQYEPDHVPPVWPSKPGSPVMAMHLDIAVDDLPATVAWAEAAGATLAGFQPQENVRVLIDPAGHPFCLFQDA